MKQTIAIVSDAVLPFNKGGKETRIHHLSRQMARRGYRVEIYTMKWWSGSGDYVSGGVRYRTISKLYPLYAGDRRSIKQAVLFALACMKLIRYDFDLLEVDHMPFLPVFSCKIVALVKRRPLLATWHEVWGREYWKRYLGRLGLIAFWIEKLSVKLPNRITAVSDQTADRLRNVLGCKCPIEVVPNGIDYDHIRQVQASKQKSDIIFAGRLLKHKNVDLLIAAAGILAQRQPSLRVLIIGDGPERDGLMQLTREKGLEKNVTFTGNLDSGDEVLALMKSSKVFVLPSEREGFGIAVIEAFACGLSAVTINHPDNAARHLVAAGDGLVCEPLATALATAISESLKHETGPVEADEFDWSRVAAKARTVYAP